MSVVQTTQISIVHNAVPVMPTDESQADTGIDHPMVFCDHCDTTWRSHGPSRCPRCARCVGIPYLLHPDEEEELMAVVSRMEENAVFDGDEEIHTQKFRDMIMEHMSDWYAINCRLSNQLCYEALRKRERNTKIEFALAFFMAEYENAPEIETMYRVEDDEEYSWTPEEEF